MNKPIEAAGRIALILLSTALLTLLVIGAARDSYAQSLFVHTTYFFMMATLLCWTGTYLHAARGVRPRDIATWLKENWPGLVIAAAVTVIAALAVHPALRMLSDEANLVGTSKNLYDLKTATFTVSGKYYYDSYWDIDVSIDQRPALFPFLVSLVHAVAGYSYKNAFLVNLMVLPALVLVAYRLAKRLDGSETFGVAAALLVVAHPITLLSARSGGFDFLALFFALLAIKSLLDYVRQPSPAGLAMLWMNLCMLAEIRYESALFILPVLALLLLFRLLRWSAVRPYVFIYALTPAYLAPRIWQAVALGSVPRQEAGPDAFSLESFLHNLPEYFGPVWSPWHSHSPHSGVIIALGIVGCILWLVFHRRSLLSLDWKPIPMKSAIFVVAWMLLQAVILFSYVWGRAQSPAAARLVLAVDTFFSFAAAWCLTVALRRWRPFVAVMLAAAVLVFHLPAAARNRMVNRLTQTRECATTWRFFESLHEKRIVIVTDRPNLYTIMDYGAMSFETAKRDPVIFEALARRLFYDIYVVQQISLSTKEPLPGYDIWPTHPLDTMLEFQNDANVLIRISRVRRS